MRRDGSRRVSRWVSLPIAALCLAVVLPLAALFVGTYLAGWQVQMVKTGSMEPTVPAGSAIVVEPVDPSDVRVGMPISFEDEQRGGILVTHRVVEVVQAEGGLAFRTRGDANDFNDAFLVPAQDVRGRMRWHVPRLGIALEWMRWPWDVLVLVVLPLALLLLSEGGRLWSRRRRRGQTERATRPRPPDPRQPPIRWSAPARSAG